MLPGKVAKKVWGQFSSHLPILKFQFGPASGHLLPLSRDRAAMKQRRSLLNRLSQQRTHTLTSWYATHSSPRSIWDTSFLFPKVAGDNSVPLSPISYSLIIRLPEYKRLSQVRLYTHCLQSFPASQCGKNNLQGWIKESHFQMLQWHNQCVVLIEVTSSEPCS